MKRLIINLVIAIPILGSCNNQQISSSERQLRSSQVATRTLFKNGKITSTVLPNKNNSQIIKPSEESSLKSFSLEFPPGSLSIPIDIQLEEGKPSNTSIIKSDLGLPESENLVRTGAPLIISSQKKQILTKPMVISMKLPDQIITNLTKNTNYVVAYQVYKEDSKKLFKGYKSSEEITISSEKIQFSTKYFGKFEVFSLSSKINFYSDRETKLENFTTNTLKISNTNKMIVKGGDKIVIKGSSFTKDIIVSMGNKVASNFEIINESTLNLTIASDIPFGINELLVSNNLGSSSLKLFSRNGFTDFPLISLDPSRVCLGLQYYDQSGTKRIGTKNCKQLANCSEGNEINCKTTESFPSIDLSELNSENIKKGTSIIGIHGSLETINPILCTEDGQINCLTNSTFKAARTSNVSSSKIILGTTIGGITGTAIIPPTCSMNLQVNCITNNSYKAGNFSNLNSINIVSGISIAGVSGTALSATSVCSSNGEIGCLTDSTYKSANF